MFEDTYVRLHGSGHVVVHVDPITGSVEPKQSTQICLWTGLMGRYTLGNFSPQLGLFKHQ